MRQIVTAALFAAIAALCGCASVSARAPADGVSLSSAFAGAETEAAEKIAAPGWQDRPWWEHYGDPALNALVERALADNPGIAATRARLEQAQATARGSFAGLLPSADIAGERLTANGDGSTPSLFGLRGAAGYEIDLWGGKRAGHRADMLAADAAAADVRAAEVSLSAAVVEDWLQILALREEEAVLRRQIETNLMLLDLQQKRFENGAAGVLDVLQQKEALARAKAELPDILAQQDLARHSLAVLTGGNPSAPPAVAGEVLPGTPPLPDAGVPSELLQQRPDISAAWMRLAAADWNVESARISRLPSFDISATYTTSAAKIADLFDVWLLDMVLGAALPVFDGGERAAEQARRAALADERFQDYRAAVLGAVAEVEDALSLDSRQRMKIAATQEQLEAARDALEQAQIGYSNGSTDYLAVLDGLTGTQALERQAVRELLDLALDRVGLYRALGLRTWHEGKGGDG